MFPRKLQDKFCKQIDHKCNDVAQSVQMYECKDRQQSNTPFLVVKEMNNGSQNQED